MIQNRDILIERLEMKLSEKEREIQEMRNSLKESIINELREGMKDDLEFDKRISSLEKKVRDIGLAYEGVMKELLDQKTLIKDFKNKYIKDDIKKDVPPVQTEECGTRWPDVMAAKNNQEELPEKAVSKSNYIIAESEETVVPEKNKNTKIIIAERDSKKSGKKGEVVVEARDDEDVVIEYTR